jgi:hypothetical protein
MECTRPTGGYPATVARAGSDHAPTRPTRRLPRPAIPDVLAHPLARQVPNVRRGGVGREVLHLLNRRGWLVRLHHRIDQPYRSRPRRLAPTPPLRVRLPEPHRVAQRLHLHLQRRDFGTRLDRRRLGVARGQSQRGSHRIRETGVRPQLAHEVAELALKVTAGGVLALLGLAVVRFGEV